MVFSGSFEDQRPWFSVTITGHPSVIVQDGWAHSVLARDALAPSGAARIRSYLDAVLRYRRSTHRLFVYCRGAGVDEVVRAYCEQRGLSCLPVGTQRDLWDEWADLHRDLDLLARSHAVVWFGPRVRDGPDLVTLAKFIGIPCRVVALPDLSGDLAGEA